jgi:hypothetical protein
MARPIITHNPYTPDSGVRPPALTGRDAELAHLRSIITQLSSGGTENHVLITGLRGVGKTVLLLEFENMCVEAGWSGETNEIGSTSSIATVVSRVVRRALLQTSARKRAGAHVKRALAVLKSFQITVGDVSFTLDVDAAHGEADSGDLADDLRDLLVAVGEAAEASGRGFALILDELQNLSREDYEALIMGLHRAKQKGLPVAFVGAGLPLIPELTADAKSYAERMFMYPTIGALPHDAARDALVLPAREQGVVWDPAAVEHVLDYTEGYPYFIHAYGRKTWPGSDSARITLEDTLGAQAVVEDWLDDNFFEARMKRLSDREREYVSAMAALGDGPQSTTAVAGILRSPPSSLTRTRDDLLRSSVIYAPRRGQVDFTVPHCTAFVRRRYPS